MQRKIYAEFQRIMILYVIKARFDANGTDSTKNTRRGRPRERIFYKKERESTTNMAINLIRQSLFPENRMRYHIVEPYVPGGLGENTIMDTSVVPPRIVKLHYEFESWEGDALVTSYPIFMITEDGRQALSNAGLTGIEFDSLEVSKNDFFLEFCSDVKLPSFVWLRISGAAGKDDFGIGLKNNLIVSDRALKILVALGIPNAIIRDYHPN